MRTPGHYVAPSFTLGIEEEYFIISQRSLDLVKEQPAVLWQRYEKLLGQQVSPEFLRAQIEIGTQVHNTPNEAAEELFFLRQTIAEVANDYGLAPIAVSTHPFAQWHGQQPTNKERYSILANDLQVVGRRLLIGGMHVHVGIEDEELRVDLMNQVSYFLPHLLALSTSSPFWEGEDTGLDSYRISVFSELPRTGLPEQFASFTEYARHVQVLIDAGLIEDASKIWWDIRPSAHFPTLEMRICDVCTDIKDALCIASIFQCLLRMLYRLRSNNQRWRIYSRMLVDENRWRAQRYGVSEGLVDFGQGEVISCTDLVEEMLDLIAEDAAFFHCEHYIHHARTLLKRGTSAQQQRHLYNTARQQGKSKKQALEEVTQWLMEKTIQVT